MAYEIQWTLPPTGEQMDSVRVIGWLIQPDQDFAADQILLEIETDKAVIEVPAPAAGRMLEQLVAVDAHVSADMPVARLLLEGERPEALVPEAEQTQTASLSIEPSEGFADAGRETTAVSASLPDGRAGKVAATPAARAEAIRTGREVGAVRGTGPGGRITLADVQHGASNRSASATMGSGEKATITVSTRHGDLCVQTWAAVGSERFPEQAPTAVLIHGLFADQQAWASTAHQLSRLGLRVVALDLPGHGGSGAVTRDLAETTEAVSDAVEQVASGPLIVVGHSFGAAVATRLARNSRNTVQALVLLAPAGLGTEIEQRFIDGMLHGHSAEALGRELAKLSSSGAIPSKTFLDDLLRGMGARRAMLAELCAGVAVQGVQQIDIRPDLDSIACQAAIIHRRADGIIPWEHALNAPPRVALHLVPQVGHMPQWDAAKLTVEV